jgi:DNA-binding transcriptional ArsR family regulator
MPSRLRAREERGRGLPTRDEKALQRTLRQFKADIFQALAHPTRVAIVELLRSGELSAGEILGRLEVEQANASQHLAILRSKRIATTRKEGNQVFYSLRDPLLVEVLDVMRRYFEADLAAATAMLQGLAQEDRG